MADSKSDLSLEIQRLNVEILKLKNAFNANRLELAKLMLVLLGTSSLDETNEFTLLDEKGVPRKLIDKMVERVLNLELE